MGLQEQLATALQNAHAAGDTQAAQQLAQALKQSMAQPQAAQQQSISAPPMPYSKEPPKQTDSALGYSVDQAQRLAGKGVEAFGDLVGSDTVKQYGTGVVAQQDKDIEEGGYKSSYDGSLRETYEKGGFSEAVGWIAEGLAENTASGGVAIAGGGLAFLTAPFSLGASAVIGGATLATSTAMATGESAFEQEEKTGDYDSKLAAGTGVIVGILDRFGASKVIPKPDLAKLSGQELVEKLIKAGKPNAAQAIGKRILKSTVGEGATETAQEAVIAGSAAVRGGEYTQDELIDRGLESFVLGGAMGGSTTTTIEAAKATGRGIQNVTGTAPEVVTPEVQAARSDFANRLQNIAVQNGMNLNNVGKMGSKGAVDAVDVAHKDIVKDITLAVSSINKDATFSLNEKPTDSAELAAKKANARNAISAAKNKVKGIVSAQDISALEELVGGTLEGQQLLNAVRESNELTALHKSGYVGGVSQYTDLLAPMGGGAGYDRSAINAERLLRPLLTGGAAAQTGGVSLIGQTAGFVAGRAIDAVTGRRSRVARYIKNNTGQGQGTTSVISTRSRAIDAYRRKEEERRQKKLAALVKQREARKEQLKRQAEKQAEEQRKQAINQQLWDSGARERQGYTGGSPQDVLLRATGMDIPNLVKTLAYIIRNNPLTSGSFVSAKSAMRSLKKGGEIKYLNELITFVKDNYEAAGATQPNQPEPRAFGEYQEGQRRSRAYEEGKRQNIAAANALIDAVQQDGSLDALTKGLILERLQEYANGTIGSDPVRAIQMDMESAVQKGADMQAVQKYMAPYLDRIMKQQPQQGTGQQQPPQPQPEPQPQPQPEPEPQPERKFTLDKIETDFGTVYAVSDGVNTLHTMRSEGMTGGFAWYQVDERGFQPETSGGIPNQPIGDTRGEAINALEKMISEMPFKKPQPDLDKITPIVSTVTPNFAVPDKDVSLQDLTKQLEDAKNDQRHIDHWGSAREDIAGQANLGGAFTPEAVALIAAVKAEIDAICDRFGVPRIRGMKSIKSNARTVARMGGGIMSFNPRYFNDWAALGNRSSLVGNRVQGGPTVDYDPNVTFADRPYNNFMYYGTGIDRVRQVMYHEIGHHIHQMAFPDKTSILVDSKGNSLAYLSDMEIEVWLENNKRDILNINTKDALPSRYAAYNEKEWWCENFSEYFMGHKERSVPQFISLIESILLKGDLSDA